MALGEKLELLRDSVGELRIVTITFFHEVASSMLESAEPNQSRHERLMDSHFQSQMLTEALDAPERVRNALSIDGALYEELGEKLRRLDPSVVATIARGSSDHAANYASYLIPLCLGVPVASLPPSLVSILAAPLKLDRQVVLALSQSGGSPDIIRSVEATRKSGALTIAIVNDASSQLAKTAEIVCAQNAGVEKSLAATKTVLCTLTAIARIVAAWSNDKILKAGIETLPAALSQAVAVGRAADPGLLAGVSHVYVISRGLGMTAALETALKLKETCGLHAEAFSSAEVRHGPREIVDNKYLVIAYAFPGSGLEGVLETASELKNQGARVIVIAPPGTETTFALPALQDPRLMPLAALALVYPWLARASRALGRDPDHPKTLKSKIIHTV
jgi:glucosamine--fructose-6-phosphate aminotransferase (isomerizing)